MDEELVDDIRKLLRLTWKKNNPNKIFTGSIERAMLEGLMLGIEIREELENWDEISESINDIKRRVGLT